MYCIFYELQKFLILLLSIIKSKNIDEYNVKNELNIPHLKFKRSDFIKKFLSRSGIRCQMTNNSKISLGNEIKII